MSTAVLDQLNEAIDAVAAVDVDALADGVLDALVIGLQRAKHRLAGATATPAGPLGHGVGVARRSVT